MLLRSPCKILEPYENHFWGFEQERKKEKAGAELCQAQDKLGLSQLYLV
jgi:hypothetical protein